MFRPATRLIAPSVRRAIPCATAAPTRRFLSTAPPTQKSRSWKSLAARIAIAGAIIYYYNTTDVFAEQPRQALTPLPETEEENENLPTIEALALQRQQRKAELEAAAAKEAASAQQQQSQDGSVGGGVEGLEEEAGQQGAFNPETGEINWDCPCLGGMAHGPCGEQFKAAFSCFVFSTEEPKGMDCIDKFKDMQNCFREYPEVYGSELEADEDDDATAGNIPAEGAPAAEQTSTPAATGTLNEPTPESPSDDASSHGLLRPTKPDNKGLVPDSYKPDTESKPEKAKAEKTSEVVPTAAFDGTAQAADRK